MPTRVSKFLLGLEALLLIVPISFLFITLLPGAFALLFKPQNFPAASLLTFAMGAALLSAARVIAAFYLDGVLGLRRVHGVWWFLCAAGALISVAGVVTATLRKSVDASESDFIFVLKLSAVGVPLMIPLAHVLLEYFFRKQSAHAA